MPSIYSVRFWESAEFDIAPVETAPATSSPIVAKQNGHIVHLPAAKFDR